MKIITLHYHHRYGNDTLLLRYEDEELPPITNEIINAIMGVNIAELERADEDANWGMVFDVETLPTIASITPKQELPEPPKPLPLP